MTRVLALAAIAAIAHVCSPEPAAPPPMGAAPSPQLGGSVVRAGTHYVELVGAPDGRFEAVVVGEAGAPPDPTLEIHATVMPPGAPPEVVVLTWDAERTRYVGALDAPPPPDARLEVDVHVGAVVERAKMPEVVVVELPPPGPVVVGAAPRVDVVHAPTPRPAIVVAGPARPTVVVEAPSPTVVVHAPAPPSPTVVVRAPDPRPRVVVEAPAPRAGVVVVAPGPPPPPGVVVVAPGPPRPGVVVVGPGAPRGTVRVEHGRHDRGHHRGHGRGHGRGHR